MRPKFAFPSKPQRHHLHIALFATLGIFFICGGVLFLWIASFKIPDLSSFQARQVSQSTKIYDRTGTILLYDVNQGVKRTIVPDEGISRNIKNATVAIEDSEFYQHHGIKFTSIIRAILANFLHLGYDQGGSTITQQVVKNSLLTTEKKVSRKLKEWILALKLERVLSKTEILDVYLNEAPYGGNIYGIEEASEMYFGKKAADLTVAEAAYLAALPNAPTYYSPYGNNRDKLESRKNLVLKRMLDNKFVAEDEYQAALREKVTFLPREDLGIKAPHFVIFVEQYLENKYGKEMVASGGLKVTTTLDWDLEQKAEQIVKQYALQNEINFNASNAGLVSIDAPTGQVLTMVGSRDYFDKKIDGNFNITIAHRQPGSSFKPFVYSEAFIKGYTPDTVVFDLPTEFSTECNPDGTPIKEGDEAKCYRPENFDGQYRGPMTLRNALAQSINIPAIQVLYLAGLRDSLKLAKDFGISSLTNTDQYGLTLVLGGGEVSLLEMTDAYATFATEGAHNPYQVILKVEDKDGNVLESFTPNPSTVVKSEIADTISDILNDNVARTPEFGDRSALYFPGRDVAVKTGTTNDYRDAWVIGYTPQIAVGAWAGNNDNSPMQKKIAGFIVAPMWNAFMQEVLKVYPPVKFKKPPAEEKSLLKPVLAGFWQGGTPYFIDKITGGLATEYTPPPLREERVVQNIHSILYWVDKNNPRGPQPTNPDIDPQFKLWEYAVAQWAKDRGYADENPDYVIPKIKDSVHGPGLGPVLSVISPNRTSLYDERKPITIAVQTSGRFPVSKVDYYVGGAYVGSASAYPFSLSFVPKDIDGLAAVNDFRAVAYDTVLNRTEATSTFTVNFTSSP